MAQLIECIECGAKISSDVKWECPQCRKYPYPVFCLLCHRSGPSSNLVRGCHPECLAALPDEKCACPTCGEIISYQDSCQDRFGHSYQEQARMECPKCGQPIELTKCYICSRYVAHHHSTTLRKPAIHQYDQYVKVHQPCYDLQVRYRRESGLCTSCGGW